MEGILDLTGDRDEPEFPGESDVANCLLADTTVDMLDLEEALVLPLWGAFFQDVLLLEADRDFGEAVLPVVTAGFFGETVELFLGETVWLFLVGVFRDFVVSFLFLGDLLGWRLGGAKCWASSENWSSPSSSKWYFPIH